MAKKTISTKKEFKISDLNDFLSGVNEQGGLIEDIEDINTKEFIPTGIYILDAALSTRLLDGGIPNNKVIGIGGASGTAKCVRGETLIPTDNGLLRIDEIIPDISKKITKLDIKIKGWNNIDTANAGYIDSIQKVWDIKTSRGYSLGGSEKHRIMVWSKETNGFIWKHMPELKVGDIVPIDRRSIFPTNYINIENIIKNSTDMHLSYSKNVSNLITLDEDLAWFMGMIVGDGCIVDQTKKIAVASVNEQTRTKLINIITKYELNPEINPTSICTNSVILFDIFKSLGMAMTGSKDKLIPVTIRQSPKSVQAAFLRGLFDSDGGISKKGIFTYCTKSDRLATEVHNMLLNFGIISRLVKKKSSWTYKGIKKTGLYNNIFISGHNLITYKNEIGFTINYKLDILNFVCAKEKNTNIDLAPFVWQVYNIDLKLKELKLPTMRSRDNKINISKIFRESKSLSYDLLNNILNKASVITETKEYKELNELVSLNYYYDTITEIDNTKEALLYDLVVPESNSFAGNGFMNHNTFLCLNIAKGAQEKGYFVVYLDSENAIDLNLVNKFGIDTKMFRIDPIATVEDLKQYLAKFIKRLEEAKEAKMEIPKIMLFLDSLGNLASEKEVADAEAGASKADMTRAKQLKSIFRIVTHKLGILGIPMVLTNHTYMCLTAGHEVLMGDGSYKEIQDITSGDFVQTLIGPKEVTNNVEFENCPIIRIELETGEIIKCTPEHKFLVKSEWSDDETNSCWKEAKDLKDTDYILSIEDIKTLSNLKTTEMAL